MPSYAIVGNSRGIGLESVDQLSKTSFNAILPLIEQGEEWKIVHISSTKVDIDLIKKTGLPSSVAYAVGKASMNVVIAKYAAELAPKGIKSLALSPGW
ncbi:uncharacterized protein Z518_11134 [Rhinocladiella mackenziei CBS 650.93]|uniref:Uncharacterized protein n=1 Tax=Rhinocladiella mackenziei CBS 650.93 TaxID=1442369 RepID=A0A0D2FC89_9EURO|nr:uncharacterized protein Z518_11134 [Rhinocladiella mackenziei CBS 650.93]KIW99721.1 hypothetical protein Z518_11134 [Rhinocladiella mackenziei CBS 650.93]